MKTTRRIAMLAALACSLWACSSDTIVSTIKVKSLGSKLLVFERDFVSSAYGPLDSEHSFWFSDMPLERLLASDRGEPITDAVFLHAQLMWIPEPGKTPLDDTATNLVTRLLVVSGGEVGLYGGAGFARPTGVPGKETVELRIEGGSLSLLAKTSGFRDLLSPADLSGTFEAPLAPDVAGRWRRAVSQFATNKLGRSMWVMKDAGLDSGLDAGEVLTLR